jgi:hypothetical protein
MKPIVAFRGPAPTGLVRAGFVAAGLIAAGVDGPAIGVLGVGAPAFAAPRPQPSAFKLAAAVKLENKRPVALLDFEIVAPARDKVPETVVGKLEKPLAAGASASFPLTGGAGCHYEARWTFEDAKDAGDVDLCNDAHIILAD